MYLGRIVESGPAEQVIGDPRHPYTQSLLSVVPSPYPREVRRQILAGELPDAANVPTGCRFHPRCPKAFDRCPQDDPRELIGVGPRRTRHGLLARRWLSRRPTCAASRGSTTASTPGSSCAELAARDDIVRVIPAATLEDHGYHLPIDTDVRLVEAIARGAVERFNAQGDAKALLCPTQVHGYTPHHLDFPGSVTLRWNVFVESLLDQGRSLIHHGFDRILIVNGHGSNIPLVNMAARLLNVEHRTAICASSFYLTGEESLAGARRSTARAAPAAWPTRASSRPACTSPYPPRPGADGPGRDRDPGVVHAARRSWTGRTGRCPSCRTGARSPNRASRGTRRRVRLRRAGSGSIRRRRRSPSSSARSPSGRGIRASTTTEATSPAGGVQIRLRTCRYLPGGVGGNGHSTGGRGRDRPHRRSTRTTRAADDPAGAPVGRRTGRRVPRRGRRAGGRSRAPAGRSSGTS